MGALETYQADRNVCRAFVLLVAAALWLTAVSCATPQIAPTPTPGPRISSAEVVAFVKAYWEKNKEAHVSRIRGGALDKVAWRSVEECRASYARDVWSNQCGDFGNVEKAGQGMVVAAIQLANEGSWSASWESSPGSWALIAWHKAFTWEFRLYETTLTVEGSSSHLSREGATAVAPP